MVGRENDSTIDEEMDGYDPDDKTERGGRESQARKAIREAVLSDPFGDSTRREKRTLLVISILVLVVNTGLEIKNIPYWGALEDEQSAAAILGLLSIGLVYLLIIFVVSVGLELSRWHYLGNNFALKGIADNISAIKEFSRILKLNLPKMTEEPEKTAMQKALIETEKEMPDINARINRTMAYYDSTSRLQWFRIIIVDVALPLIVGLIALWKVSAAVFPMIWTILTA